jgi:hypothetical protein
MQACSRHKVAPAKIIQIAASARKRTARRLENWRLNLYLEYESFRARLRERGTPPTDLRIFFVLIRMGGDRA